MKNCIYLAAGLCLAVAIIFLVKYRKSWKYVTALSLCLILLSGSSVVYAYFADRPDKLVNKFEMGEDETEIIEEFVPPDPQPNKTYTKKVKIKNNGNVKCYVRVRLDCSDGDVEKYLTYSGMETGWTKESDGFYYYKNILAPGEETSYLLKEVSISADITDDLLKQPFSIYVNQESIQSDGFESVKDAFAMQP